MAFNITVAAAAVAFIALKNSRRDSPFEEFMVFYGNIILFFSSFIF